MRENETKCGGQEITQPGKNDCTKIVNVLHIQMLRAWNYTISNIKMAGIRDQRFQETNV